MTPNSQTERREAVNQQVDELFAKSAAFQALPPDERAKVQQNTADIINAMADNKLAQASQLQSADPYAIPMVAHQVLPGGQTGGQAPPFTGGATQRPEDVFGPKEVGDFGTALATGVAQAGELLRQVNFPAFVAELIQGVFQAVVDASIQQMRAYGELVQGVVMSLNDFRDANVTQNQARDHLVSKFPNLMQINITDQGPRAGLRPGADTDELPNISSMLGMDGEITDLDDEMIEEQLVPAARNDLARSRQTLLATMLLMGINRIVVTDGKINARLKFDFRARDTQVTHAQEYDYENFGTTVATQREFEREATTGEGYKENRWRSRGWRGASRSGESSRWSRGSEQRTETPAVYLTSVEDTQTSAELEAKAKLLGEVSLNFRSDVVDLNQLASNADIFRLERVRSAGRGAPGAPVTTSPGGGGETAGTGAGEQTTTGEPGTAA